MPVAAIKTPRIPRSRNRACLRFFRARARVDAPASQAAEPEPVGSCLDCCGEGAIDDTLHPQVVKLALEYQSVGERLMVLEFRAAKQDTQRLHS